MDYTRLYNIFNKTKNRREKVEESQQSSTSQENPTEVTLDIRETI
jgi:hypothetical protein